MLRFAGIDLTSSPRKNSAYALLTSDWRISHLISCCTDDEIVAVIQHDRPTLIGIDAPLSMPRGLGLCCLQRADCSCRPESEKKGRLCERELSREGIRSFFTTEKSIIKEMIVRAVELKKRLESSGFEVLEVYPYATKRRLWSDEKIPRKTTAAGLKFLHDRISQLITNLDDYGRLNHDQYDSILAAHTVFLYFRDEAELVGDPDEGQIAIPHKSEAAHLTKKARKLYI